MTADGVDSELLEKLERHLGTGHTKIAEKFDVRIPLTALSRIPLVTLSQIPLATPSDSTGHSLIPDKLNVCVLIHASTTRLHASTTRWHASTTRLNTLSRARALHASTDCFFSV